jgi:hypothetical protein
MTKKRRKIDAALKAKILFPGRRKKMLPPRSDVLQRIGVIRRSAASKHTPEATRGLP